MSRQMPLVQRAVSSGQSVAIFATATALAILLATSAPAALAALPESAAAGEMMPPQTIQIESAAPPESPLQMVGSDARIQLLVTGTYADGLPRDLSRVVSYTVDPPQVAAVDSTGLVTPLAAGTALITASAPGGAQASREVVVTDFANHTEINFPNQITPIFTKLACNSGGCHGKASGQNGFKLSLLGFEPDEDFEYLVKESRGRRLFPAAPERSLLLTKAVNSTPHGGGQRMEPDSNEYRLLHRWIAQGMPYGKSDAPTVDRIEVFPVERRMERHSKQQLSVVAYYTDGTFEDVTRTAQFDPNDAEMAEASATGLVETLDLTGDVAIMARYQGKVAVFRASIPLGAASEQPQLEPRNFIDELVFGKLDKLGIPPSSVCDDSTFVRRLYIDIAGRIPTAEEARVFIEDADPGKRDKLIDQLLSSGDYADYFANKWSAVLRNKRRDANHQRGTFAFHAWIRDSLYTNKPYDEFVREIVAASGEVGTHPPVVWYREVRDMNQQVEDTAQLFLGMRIQCARCHHHPFEKWSQRDYYSFAAFFAQVARKPGDQPSEERIHHRQGRAAAQNPKTGEWLIPAGLDSEPLTIDHQRDPRHELVNWMSAPENPFFAPALVNRYWKHFLDRGLVDPEDDMRVTNPASNPDLMDALARHFIDSQFDLKQLVRSICQSHTYQLSSDPNELNLSDKQNYSRYYPKRLSAEVLLDAVDQASGSQTSFAGLPAGTRAVALPDQGTGLYFLTVFGRPEGDTACECERSDEANLAQSLHLLNSAEMQAKLTAETSRAAQYAADTSRSDEEKLHELYLSVFARRPQPEELQVALGHLTEAPDKRLAYEDLIWALVNTKEFLFNH